MENPEESYKYYEDLIGVELQFPCNSWEDRVALRCFGPNYHSNFVRGFVSNVKINRKTLKPSFGIIFPDKKYDKRFEGYNLEYIQVL
jgi:hypothetical protein